MTFWEKFILYLALTCGVFLLCGAFMLALHKIEGFAKASRKSRYERLEQQIESYSYER